MYCNIPDTIPGTRMKPEILDQVPDLTEVTFFEEIN